MSVIRITIELDLDSDYVEGQRYERMANATRSLHRHIEAGHAALYAEDTRPDDWTERPVRIHTPGGLVTIGRFLIEHDPKG